MSSTYNAVLDRIDYIYATRYAVARIPFYNTIEQQMRGSAHFPLNQDVKMSNVTIPHGKIPPKHLYNFP